MLLALLINLPFTAALTLAKTAFSWSTASALLLKVFVTLIINESIPYSLINLWICLDDVKYVVNKSLGWQPLAHLTP